MTKIRVQGIEHGLGSDEITIKTNHLACSYVLKLSKGH